MILEYQYSQYHGLDDFSLFIEEKKLNYLKEKKTGTLKKLGGRDILKEQLEAIILERISSNYIFNLDYSPEYDVSKFNIIFEVEDIYGTPHKVIVSLEYIFMSKQLRVITLF